MRSSLLLLAVALALICIVQTANAGASSPSVRQRNGVRRHHSRGQRTRMHDAEEALLNPTASSVTDWYHAHWCGQPGSMTWLDDAKCQKRFPSKFDRDWTSFMRVSSTPSAAEGWATDTGNFADVKVNTTALTGLGLLGNANLCLILIKRIDGPCDTTSSVPCKKQMDPSRVFYRYLCGAGDDTKVWQPWSSTKIYAAANAGSHIRMECPASNSGFTSSTTGKHGVTPLGDLLTVIATYDSTQGYTSNGLSSYMHDIGGRQRIKDLVQSWFAPKYTGNSLGGNYGEPSPPDLGFVLDGGACQAPNTTRPFPLIPNSLSALAHVELLRRLALWSDVQPNSRFPDTTLDDMTSILYGANTSLLFPGLQWGGMATDTSIFVQSAVDMDQIEKEAMGTWRIHSKMGAGWDSGRGVGEMVSATYAAWPVLDPVSGEPIMDKGLEFIIVGRASVANDPGLVQAEQVLHSAIVNTVQALVAGKF